MGEWIAFPYDAAPYTYEAAALKDRWARLHAGDTEPLPADDRVLGAWALFHAGAFRRAVEAGLAAGGAGITAANKAQVIYASYLEKHEGARLALLLEVAERAEAQAAAEPGNANAFYFMAYALGRYRQGICCAAAPGLLSKVKGALELTIRLAPRHADARLALGAFHAALIDKLGVPLARAQGASKDTGLDMYRQALQIVPASAIASVAYAGGLVMLDGATALPEAERLYADAAACEPLDAMERLGVEMAKAELEE